MLILLCISWPRLGRLSSRFASMLHMYVVPYELSFRRRTRRHAVSTESSNASFLSVGPDPLRARGIPRTCLSCAGGTDTIPRSPRLHSPHLLTHLLSTNLRLTPPPTLHPPQPYLASPIHLSPLKPNYSLNNSLLLQPHPHRTPQHPPKADLRPLRMMTSFSDSTLSARWNELSGWDPLSCVLKEGKVRFVFLSCCHEIQAKLGLDRMHSNKLIEIPSLLSVFLDKPAETYFALIKQAILSSPFVDAHLAGASLRRLHELICLVSFFLSLQSEASYPGSAVRSSRGSMAVLYECQSRLEGEYLDILTLSSLWFQADLLHLLFAEHRSKQPISRPSLHPSGHSFCAALERKEGRHLDFFCRRKSSSSFLAASNLNCGVRP